MKKFERFIIISLLSMMTVVVFIATLELAVIIVQEVIDLKSILLLDVSEMLNIFGFFLMILIGIELIETMKVYLADDSVHVEIIFLVAIIAVTRKVIILDVKTMSPMTLIGVSALILSLSVGYYAVSRAMTHKT
jgi:uncharacterized membrane protein (DUF373 family)